MPRRDRDALAARLLDAMLAHVPFEGWSSLALRTAADDVGVDWPTAKRVFPGGVEDVLALWGVRSDQRMIADLGDLPGRGFIIPGFPKAPGLWWGRGAPGISTPLAFAWETSLSGWAESAAGALTGSLQSRFRQT